MGGRRPEEHITDRTNTSMVKTSRKQKRIVESSEGGQGPEGAWMDGWIITHYRKSTRDGSSVQILQVNP
jgi:hypothetical protein